MATPVKNKLLIGERAVWSVFKVKCESIHYLPRSHMEGDAVFCDVIGMTPTPAHRSALTQLLRSLCPNEPLRNHYRRLLMLYGFSI